jgi:transcriptional regulator with XRE-family HTH domain
MNFQKLIELREDFNLKQKDIAKLLNITQQTYSLWENGSKIIPLKHLNSLCNYYNVSMDYMLGLSNKNSFNNGKYNIDKKIIGRRLKEFRKEKNITQEELVEESIESYNKKYNSNISLEDFTKSISGYASQKVKENVNYDEVIAEAIHDYYLHRDSSSTSSLEIINIIKERLQQ